MRSDLLARIQATKVPFKIYTDYVEDEALKQFAECLEQPSVVQGALMPDTHAGYVAPIGSVLKTEGTIFPSFVGYDIGCGMSECKLDIDADLVKPKQLEKIKDAILNRIPTGFSRNKKKEPVKRAITGMPMSDFAKQVLKEQGEYQIGTLGGGNHFLEIGTTNDNKLSIVVHSGSRGVGHKIATHHMKAAAIQNTDEQRYIDEFDKKNSNWAIKIKTTRQSKFRDELQENYNKARDEFVYRRVRARVDNIEDGYPLTIDTPEGQEYVNDMNMVLDFALANREAMISKTIEAISEVLSIKPKRLRFINKNHNHAELVDGFWIHRKGATQAAYGMLGVIPGNMVDGSFIVKGKGNLDSMNSSSHGAGRVLSRRQAKEQLSLEDFQECTKHLVANHSDSNLDEAPKAYKSIFEVMENQSDLVEVLDKVVPVLNIKG